ncbi:uncharacterized protein Pyn_31892 [Prunus yedoensis var. nudiflora]|uniref:Retrotransposon gag domain-containing protein n=1 Tax=Prunus yedoensis var. nudiflora TaxID=2094558 RepID=A0A314YKF0_PRUYE|nr:uncharacterized protein Pyn_31892 [Prunus yedoensis var. nudiflora]
MRNHDWHERSRGGCRWHHLHAKGFGHLRAKERVGLAQTGGEIEIPRGPEFTKEEISLPYTRDLLETKAVRDSKAPKIPLYDGMTNPYDHLDNFRYAMEERMAHEATKCRMLPTTLKGPVTSWFKRLAPKLINCFVELRKVSPE